MSIKDFFKEINLEVDTVISSNFKIEVIETDTVPDFDDPNITYDDLDSKVKKCKSLESCVLYVDMRDSTKISAAKRPATLSKIYSSFVRSMIAAARYNNGHVRNIIGDRVMVVFDKKDCFKKAIDTAITMNSISEHILNKRIRDIDFRCGIGIDYGKMLIAKAGAVRRGAEKEFYRSLVWLGKPANVASRLTDIANKKITTVTEEVCQGNYYPLTNKWSWFNKTYGQFLDELEPTYSRALKHNDNYFKSFFKTSSTSNYTPSPILMTESVFNGLKREDSTRRCIINNWWKEQALDVRDYDGKVFGGDIIFTAVQEIR